ncbi:hypothetical protein WME88_31765 [Sorangium sp. So ce216]
MSRSNGRAQRAAAEGAASAADGAPRQAHPDRGARRAWQVGRWTRREAARARRGDAVAR